MTDVFAEVALELLVLVADARVELLVSDLPFIPRTLGIVPIGPVCCASRVRVTSRMLNKMRLVRHLDFQVMAFQAQEQTSTVAPSHMRYAEPRKRSVTPVGTHS